MSREVVRLNIRAKPRASRSRIVKCEGLSIEVALAAPPADGAANAELIEVVARALSLPKSALELSLGKASKHKVIEVSGLGADEVALRLASAAARK